MVEKYGGDRKLGREETVPAWRKLEEEGPGDSRV